MYDLGWRKIHRQFTLIRMCASLTRMTRKKTAEITKASSVTPMKTKEDFLYTEEWISKTVSLSQYYHYHLNTNSLKAKINK